MFMTFMQVYQADQQRNAENQRRLEDRLLQEKERLEDRLRQEKEEQRRELAAQREAMREYMDAQTKQTQALIELAFNKKELEQLQLTDGGVRASPVQQATPVQPQESSDHTASPPHPQSTQGTASGLSQVASGGSSVVSGNANMTATTHAAASVTMAPGGHGGPAGNTKAAAAAAESTEQHTAYQKQACKDGSTTTTATLMTSKTTTVSIASLKTGESGQQHHKAANKSTQQQPLKLFTDTSSQEVEELSFEEPFQQIKYEEPLVPAFRKSPLSVPSRAATPASRAATPAPTDPAAVAALKGFQEEWKNYCMARKEQQDKLAATPALTPWQIEARLKKWESSVTVPDTPSEAMKKWEWENGVGEQVQSYLECQRRASPQYHCSVCTAESFCGDCSVSYEDSQPLSIGSEMSANPGSVTNRGAKVTRHKPRAEQEPTHNLHRLSPELQREYGRWLRFYDAMPNKTPEYTREVYESDVKLFIVMSAEWNAVFEEKMPLAMTKDRLGALSRFILNGVGCTYPPPPVAYHQNEFEKTYLEIKGSDLGEHVGQGLFVATVRADKNDHKRITAVPPFSLFYKGQIQDKLSTADKKRSDIVQVRKTPPRYIVPSAIPILKPTTAYINDNVFMNTPLPVLTNMHMTSNQSGEIRAEKPIKAGTELTMPYGAEYNWIRDYCRLVRLLGEELQALHRDRRKETEQTVKELLQHTETISKWVISEGLMPQELDEQAVYIVVHARVGDAASTAVWEQSLELFMTLWEVVASKYKTPKTSARLSWPHDLLQVQRFSSHFTFGLAGHSGYAKYSREEFRMVFATYFDHRSEYELLVSLDSYTNGPYNARLRAMEYDKTGTSSKTDWTTTWIMSDFRAEAKSTKKSARKRKDEQDRRTKEHLSFYDPIASTSDEEDRKEATKSSSSGGIQLKASRPFTKSSTSSCGIASSSSTTRINNGSSSNGSSSNGSSSSSSGGTSSSSSNGNSGNTGGGPINTEASAMDLEKRFSKDTVWTMMKEQMNMLMVKNDMQGAQHQMDLMYEYAAVKAREAERSGTTRESPISLDHSQSQATPPLTQATPPQTPPRNTATPTTPFIQAVSPMRPLSELESTLSTTSSVTNSDFLIENLQVEYNFNQQLWVQQGRPVILFSSRKSNTVQRFNNDGSIGFESWLRQWRKAAEEKNQHPIDLGKQLTSSEALGDGKGGPYEKIQDAMDLQRQCTSHINPDQGTLWHTPPENRDNLSAAWTWLRLVIAELCKSYRTIKSVFVIQAQLMDLKLKTRDIRGLQQLWDEMATLYRQLPSDSKKGVNMREYMQGAIGIDDIQLQYLHDKFKERCQQVTGTLIREGRLRDGMSTNEQAYAIAERAVQDLDLEWRQASQKSQSSKTTATAQKPVRAHSLMEEYPEEEYPQGERTREPEPPRTFAAAVGSSQQTQHTPTQPRGGGQYYNSQQSAVNSQQYNRSSPWGQSEHFNSKMAAGPPATHQAPQQAPQRQGQGNAPPAFPQVGSNQQGQPENGGQFQRNPLHPDGRQRCPICGQVDHGWIQCPFRTTDKGINKLDVNKLAAGTKTPEEALRILDDARQWGNLCRKGTQGYEMVKNELLKILKQKEPRWVFKPGGSENKHSLQQPLVIQVFACHTPLEDREGIVSAVCQAGIVQTPHRPWKETLARILKLDHIDNKTLSYFNLQVRKLWEHFDEEFAETNSMAVPLKENEMEETENYHGALGMKDSGSSATLCNQDFVRRIKAHVVPRSALPLLGVAGTAPAEQVAVFVAVVKGLRYPQRDQEVKRKLLIQALIVPGMASELILGGNFINRHNIRCNPDSREAVFFRGTERIVVSWAPWPKVEEQLQREHKRRTQTILEPTRRPLSARVAQLNPTTASHNQSDAATAPQGQYTATTATHSQREQQPTAAPTNQVPQARPKRLPEREQFQQCVREQCTQLLPHLRPPLFPEELWPLVADSEKLGDENNPSVKDRWAAYPEERQKECIEIMNSVRISKENPEREEQEPLFRAQLFANIDAFCHVDEMHPPCTKGYTASIRLKEGVTPATCRLTRKIPLARACLYQRTTDMLEMGRLERSKSPWNHATNLIPYPERIKAFLTKYRADAPRVMYDRKYKKEVIPLFRTTGDLRQLNQRSVAEIFPMPRVLDKLDQCYEKSNRYSCGDMEDGFFRILLEEGSRECTAFSTEDDHLQYCVLPQGLHTAPAIFCRIINEIFADLRTQYLINYVDDVIQTPDNLSAHFKLQQLIYNKLRANCLTFKPSKTTINFMTQKILGHIMSQDGRAMDPEIIRAIMRWERPKDLTSVQSLLGSAKLATAYVPDLASILSPLHDLNRKNIDIEAEWAEKHEKALNELKRILTTSPVLMIYIPHGKCRIHVDACKVGRGFGAVLLQADPDRGLDEKGEPYLRPVCYWSRQLTTVERNISSVELECTAMHDAILHWHIYLYCSVEPFDVIVDCYALVYLVCKMGGNAFSHQRLTRLCMELQGYRFAVTHRKGTEHLDADALSRLLQYNELPYVRDDTHLRDDIGPLTEDDIQDLKNKYTHDADKMISIINDHKEDRRAQLEEYVKDAEIQVSGETDCSDQCTHPQPPTDGMFCVDCTSSEPDTGESETHQCGECGMTVNAATIIVNHITLMNEKAEMGRKYVCNEKASIAQLDRHLSWNGIKWGSPEGIILRAQILRTIADRGICCHRENEEEHNRFHPHCNRRGIQSIRSSTLVELEDKHEKGVMKLNRMIVFNILAELKRRTTNEVRHHTQLPKRRRRRTQASSVTKERADHLLAQWLQIEDQHQLPVPRRTGERTTRRPVSRTHKQDRKAQQRERQMEQSIEEEQVYWRDGVRINAYTGIVWEGGIMANAGRITRSTTKRAQQEPQQEKSQEQPQEPQQEPTQEPGAQEPRQETPSPSPRTEHGTATLQVETQSVPLQQRAEALLEPPTPRPLRPRPAIERPVTRLNTASNRPTAEALALQREKEYREKIAREREERELEQQQEELENHHHLHQQHYLHPSTGQLYEIIDTEIIGRRGSKNYKIYTVAWPIQSEGLTAEEQLDERKWDKRNIAGTEGTIELLKSFRSRENPLWDAKLPIDPAEWLLYQRDDRELRKYIDKCDSADKHLTLNNSANKRNNHEYLHRSVLPSGRLGPLCRRFTHEVVTTHGNTQHTTVQTVDQIVIPKGLRQAVLFYHHDQMGHPGGQRLADSIRLKYWWPAIVQEAKLYASRCRYCELRKADNMRPKIPIQHYRIPLHPFHAVHMDLTGPLPESEGYKYILVFKCALTKYTIIRKLRDKTMESVRAALLEVCHDYGPPRILLSDRGTEFSNRQVKQVCRLLMIHRIQITAANPRSNGLAENAMRTIKDMLAAYTDRRHNDWSEHLSCIQHIYNTTINLSTGFTPFYHHQTNQH